MFFPLESITQALGELSLPQPELFIDPMSPLGRARYGAVRLFS